MPVLYATHPPQLLTSFEKRQPWSGRYSSAPCSMGVKGTWLLVVCHCTTKKQSVRSCEMLCVKNCGCFSRGDCRPTFAAVTDVIRDEVRRAMAPTAPAEFERPVPTYTEASHIPPPVVERPVASYRDVLRTPVSAPVQLLPPVTESFTRILSPASRNDPRAPERKSVVWRTPDNRPLCYHCGEAGHVLRHCPYRQMGLRGFSPDAPRPRYGERPQEIEQYLAAHEPPTRSTLPPAIHQPRSSSPRRYSSPSRPGSPRSTGNRFSSPRRGN